MRIAFSVETFLPKIDGIVTIACLTLEYLRENGVNTILLAPQQGIREYADAPVIGVPCIVNPLYPEGRVSFPTPNTYRVIRDFHPDLVHAIDPGFIGAGALFAAKSLRVPTVASYHLSLSRAAKDYGLGFLEKPIRAMRIWGFNAVDHALAPSRQAQNLLRSGGVRRVGWWRRGVDCERFHPRFRNFEMRQRLSNGHPDDVILLYVGRLAPEKGLHLLKPLLEHISGARLALIGDGPHRGYLEGLFKGLPVVFMGYCQGEELATAYASADIFTFASSHESFGLVLAEAIASGLPVVSSRVGGADDIIQHGETGYIFDVGQMDRIEEYVYELATNEEKRKQMGLQARRFAETLKWDEIMRELIYFYEDIIREKGGNLQFTPTDRRKSPLLDQAPIP
jgi:glycosyltransferase involved in cell wall biosynthesis